MGWLVIAVPPKRGISARACCMSDSRRLTFALNAASKGAERRLRASVFQRVVRRFLAAFYVLLHGFRCGLLSDAKSNGRSKISAVKEKGMSIMMNGNASKPIGKTYKAIAKLQ